MKAVLNTVITLIASIVASTVATWLLRRIVFAVEGGRRDGEPSSTRSIVVIFPTVLAGNHWHFGQMEKSRQGLMKRGSH